MEKRELISYCGLYCGNCRAYNKGNCPGCREKTDAGWCKVRTSVVERRYFTCADCPEMDTCNIRDNWLSKIFEFVFRSDKTLNLTVMREKGYDFFVAEVEQSGKMNLDKGKSYS